MAAVTVDTSGIHFVGVSLPGPGTAGAGGCVHMRHCRVPVCTRSSVQTRSPVFVVRSSTYGSPLTVACWLIAEAYRTQVSRRRNAVFTCDCAWDSVWVRLVALLIWYIAVVKIAITIDITTVHTTTSIMVMPSSARIRLMGSSR